MSDDETRELTVRIPLDVYEQLTERAKAEERSIAATIRYAIRQYLAEPS